MTETTGVSRRAPLLMWKFLNLQADFNPSAWLLCPRNEARRIRETILSVMDAADMAVILDTGSSDGTQNIIKQATWQNSGFPTFLKPIFLLTASI